jgi:hypothetical protein
MTDSEMVRDWSIPWEEISRARKRAQKLRLAAIREADRAFWMEEERSGRWVPDVVQHFEPKVVRARRRNGPKTAEALREILVGVECERPETMEQAVSLIRVIGTIARKALRTAEVA